MSARLSFLWGKYSNKTIELLRKRAERTLVEMVHTVFLNCTSYMTASSRGAEQEPLPETDKENTQSSLGKNIHSLYYDCTETRETYLF